MGGTQSAERRKVVIENLEKESMNFVYVSDAVIDRLSQGFAPNSSHGAKGDGSFSVSNPNAHSGDKIVSDDSVQQSMAERDEQCRQMTHALSEKEMLNQRLRSDLKSTMAQIEQLQQKVRDLESDTRLGSNPGSAGYRRKMEELTARQAALQTKMKEHFKETVDAVSKKFFTRSNESLCADIEARVMQCYLDNPNRPLMCSDLVKEFELSVTKQREQLMANKG